MLRFWKIPGEGFHLMRAYIFEINCAEFEKRYYAPVVELEPCGDRIENVGT